MRFEGEEIATAGGMPPEDAPALLLSEMNVAAAHEREFNDWYSTECMPAFVEVPGMMCARYCRAVDSAMHRYLALYYLTSPKYPVRRHGRRPVILHLGERIRRHFQNDLWLVSRRYQRAA